MRILGVVLVMMGVTLSGCSSTATQPIHHQTQTPTAHKNPMNVSFYPKGANPEAPYTVIGDATISKYNKVGIKRQEANIHDAMRSTAASMGGDAIINVKRNDKTVSGTVIAYQSKITV